MKVRQITLPFTLGIKAITLYPFIFYAKGKRTPCVEAHEAVHVQQIREMGFLRFYLTYIMLSFKYGGGRRHPLEVAGYVAEDECNG